MTVFSSLECILLHTKVVLKSWLNSFESFTIFVLIFNQDRIWKKLRIFHFKAVVKLCSEMFLIFFHVLSFPYQPSSPQTTLNFKQKTFKSSIIYQNITNLYNNFPLNEKSQKKPKSEKLLKFKSKKGNKKFNGFIVIVCHTRIIWKLIIISRKSSLK